MKLFGFRKKYLVKIVFKGGAVVEHLFYELTVRREGDEIAKLTYDPVTPLPFISMSEIVMIRTIK